jgi:hypothetical protein
MSKKRRNKIEGGFVALPHNLIESEAYKSLTATSKSAYTYFKRDVRNSHQENVILTFGQAQKYGVCRSPSTFSKAKIQLVENGLLDPIDGGGLNAPAIFRLSERWRLFGTKHFKIVAYKSGFGSKYFQTAMSDETKKQQILNARHPKLKPVLSQGRTF